MGGLVADRPESARKTSRRGKRSHKMKTKNRKTVIRLYWAWNDNREERWLNRMAREGWHLTAPRGVFYTFEKGEPADIVYRLGFQTLRRPKRQEQPGPFKVA